MEAGKRSAVAGAGDQGATLWCGEVGREEEGREGGERDAVEAVVRLHRWPTTTVRVAAVAVKVCKCTLVQATNVCKEEHIRIQKTMN
jgi:hypothetical protein